jgi:hypothetical protein
MDMGEEVPLMKLSLELKPESLEILKDFGNRLHAAENELRKIRQSFSEALHKFFEVKEFPPGLGEAFVSEMDPGAARASD